MGGLARSGLGCAALTLLFSAGCSFSPAATAPIDSAPDTSPDSSVDAAAPSHGWVVASMANPNRGIVMVPYDTSTGLGNACALQPTAYSYRALYLHPTLPYLYGVEAALEGFSLSCTDIAETTLAPLGAPRPVQDIVMDPTGQTGFFTLDGTGATGVFRFTTQSDGEPEVMGSANAPAAGGPLALNASAGELFVAGAGLAYGYALVGAELDLPSTAPSATTCMQPAGLAISGSWVLVFCSDVPDLRRYSQSPFAYDSTVGSPGTVSRVVTLPDDNAIIARSNPPNLAFVTLNGGSPTWTDGPSLLGDVLAMAASVDGKYLVTASQFDAAHSQISLWRINGQMIEALTTSTVSGAIAALAITVAKS